jgi:carboxyl-terminal processing protease
MKSLLSKFIATCALALGIGGISVSHQAFAQTINYTDLWWNANESGWGIQITHHNDEMFGTWFTYDEQGNQLFITLPGCGLQKFNGRVCSGDLYRTTGTPYNAPFVSANTSVTKIGSATLTFESATSATFAYQIGGTAITKAITRQPYGSGVATFPFDNSDLYFKASESGWGYSLAQHGAALFGVIYHYDENGRPMFVTLPDATLNGNIASGTLYRTRSNGNSHYLTSTWRAADISLTAAGGVGKADLAFLPAGLNMTFSINGFSQTKEMVRQPFGAATPANALPPASLVQKLCVAPRALARYGDKPGTLEQEKRWIRSFVDETYLWYNEVPNALSPDFANARTYFDALKTPARTLSGRPKDEFHFYSDTAAYEAQSTTSSSAGYGWSLAAISNVPPRAFVVALVQPNSPAAQAGIQRGARILTVDGADLVNGSDVATLNAGLSPAALGEAHSFSILDAGAATPRNVSLTSSLVTSLSVQNVRTIDTATGPVGYMLFNTFNFPSEGQLIAGFNQLAEASVRDLVLDMRYNGGGLVYISSELAYMVAGATATRGKLYSKLSFSDKRVADNNNPNNSVPFYNGASGIANTGTTAGTPLPSLNLPRVFVLTSGSTASASEEFINGLEGIGVQVIRIGGTTRGKPYGFVPRDNCGTTYFSIEFKSTNQKGFGDYADGFPSTCQVSDDFTNQLGDPVEARLAGALNYRLTGVCPTPSGSIGGLAAKFGVSVKTMQNEPMLLRHKSEEAAIHLPDIHNKMRLIPSK